MLFVLSPSKTLDLESVCASLPVTQPEFLSEAQALVGGLRKYNVTKLQTLMNISPKLAALNVERYKQFSVPFTPENARPALLTFKGDVYAGIEVERYDRADFAFAQSHARILSGLYGVLRPLDLMQPYRLEMGIGLPNPKGKNLYVFWGKSISQSLNNAAKNAKAKYVVNLASEEYASAMMRDVLEWPVIDIVFKEHHKGDLKIIGLMAKRARGKMANWIIRNRITHVEKLQNFSESGYQFAPELSDEKRWVFAGGRPI